MAQFAALTISDGAATPVAHTFSPIDINAVGVAEYHDRALGIPVGFPKITLQVKKPTSQSAQYRVFGKVVLPVLEQSSPSQGTGFQPAPTVAYNLYCNFDFALPSRSTSANRADIIAYAKNLMAHALMTSIVKDLDSIY